ALMGRTSTDFREPRAYLIRAATHLWFDRLRRLRLERAHLDELEAIETPPEPDALDVRNAAAALFVALPPTERAAVLLKDVLDFSLTECAAMLKTSEGAVKSALHRGRARLKEAIVSEQQDDVPRVPRGLVEQFVQALSERRIDDLRALCLEDVTIDMVGG